MLQSQASERLLSGPQGPNGWPSTRVVAPTGMRYYTGQGPRFSDCTHSKCAADGVFSVFGPGLTG
jgi:hypothetical protein